eukprot:NODE_7668_length_1559_cov_7.220670.p2 GENE.NODE_7668_length_1559_cov_7.220670~~NODE_7668_length_1559_cov_7.220670.p2  ORF type:complete len:313 (+),score=107.69 NODE_7668_length_1559_cov_7.220670:3-941(+)
MAMASDVKAAAKPSRSKLAVVIGPQPVTDRASATGPVPFDSFPAEDDGSVELALLATDHPGIQRFGAALLRHQIEANQLLLKCSPWIEVSRFPQAVVQAHEQVEALLGAMHKDIEAIDSLDLDDLRPKWGDKATVRMSRKSLIAFAQVVMSRLDDLQSRLKDAARTEKLRIAQRASHTISEPTQSLEEKYSHVLNPPKRLRLDEPVTREHVQAVVEQLRAKTGQKIEKLPPSDFCRRIANLAILPQLSKTPELCRDGVECAISAAAAVLDTGITREAVLSGLLDAMQRIQTMADPELLPKVLEDLAEVLKMV